MTLTKWKARTKTELIIEVWEDLDCDSVGTVELEEILRVIAEQYGQRAMESPASIARILAAEGATLRHPEILDCDSAWRERNIARVLNFEELDFTTPKAASVSIEKFETIRRQLEGDKNIASLKLLREQVAEYRRDAEIVASSQVAGEEERTTASEIALWLSVWLQQPELFRDWLSLRISSPDFVKTHGGEW